MEFQITDDLFGSDNEDYARTTPFSRLEPPDLPTGNPKRQRRDESFQRNPNSSSYIPKNVPFKERLESVAVMKLNQIGHQDKTLTTNLPPIQQPTEIAHFSRTGDGKVYLDNRCLREFRREILFEKGADLNKDFEKFIEKREGGENPFQDLLHSIRSTKEGVQMNLQNIHFVTFRNNINKIMYTTYHRDEEWEMGVHKKGMTIYLDVHKMEENKKSNYQRRLCYYGYSYERYATRPASTDDGEKDERVVDANVEYCSVLKTKVGAHRILLGAEIDCFEKEKSSSNSSSSHSNSHSSGGGGGGGSSSSSRKSYVELKTNRIISDEKSRLQFESKKLLKYWIQSFMAGVQTVVCGFRDDVGNLVHSKYLTLKEIKEIAKNRNLWMGGACLSFLDRVLCWLYGSVRDDGNYVLRYSRLSNKLELFACDHCPDVISEHFEKISS